MDKQWWRAMQEAAEVVANDPHLAALRRQADEMEALGLSSDGTTPPPCDPEIFAKGVCVLTTGGIAPNAMEGWVQKVRLRSGQPVDWHMAGGYNRVLALGDIEAVTAAISDSMHELNLLRKRKE